MPPKKTLTLDDIRQAKKAPRRTQEITLDGTKTIEFVFRGIGRKAFEDLTEAHEDPNNAGSWDPATFGPALVAASCEEPKMSEDDAKALWADPEWSFYECDQLFAAALGVNASYRAPR